MKIKAILVVLLFIPCLVQAADREWAWVSADTLIDDWWVLKGRAQVTIDQHGNLQAELYDGQDPKYLRSTMRGKVSGSNVVVTVIDSGTDQDRDAVFKGTYTSTCEEGVFRGREVITLTDGLNWIGFTRRIPEIKRQVECAKR